MTEGRKRRLQSSRTAHETAPVYRTGGGEPTARDSGERKERKLGLRAWDANRTET